MVREYTWQFNVRSYEADAWGMASTSGILRYLEQSAVTAAADAGYGGDFHRERNSAWIVRRITLLMYEPARQADEIQITTWISHFAKVRGGREYRIRNAATGQPLYTALTEWVYVSRETLKPIAIPPQLAVGFSTPGAPLGIYDPPQVETNTHHASFTTERTAEWHEADSMAHINNANYADWLDDAVRSAIGELGWNMGALQQLGLHLRGEYYNLNYKRAALPGDKLQIATQITGVSGRLCSFSQSITDADGAEALTSNSIYGWRNRHGEPTNPPEGWV